MAYLNSRTNTFRNCPAVEPHRSEIGPLLFKPGYGTSFMVCLPLTVTLTFSPFTWMTARLYPLVAVAFKEMDPSPRTNMPRSLVKSQTISQSPNDFSDVRDCPAAV